MRRCLVLLSRLILSCPILSCMIMAPFAAVAQSGMGGGFVGGTTTMNGQMLQESPPPPSQGDTESHGAVPDSPVDATHGLPRSDLMDAIPARPAK